MPNTVFAVYNDYIKTIVEFQIKVARNKNSAGGAGVLPCGTLTGALLCARGLGNAVLFNAFVYRYFQQYHLGVAKIRDGICHVCYL